MAEAMPHTAARAPARRFARFAKRFLLVLLFLVLLPYVILPFYLVINPISTPMAWHWLTGQRVVRNYLPLQTMPRALPATVIVAEDARFCTHHGIDWQGLRQAFEEAEDGEGLRGASTITQQTVKNLFLWSGRSYLRKVLEFPLALWADLVLPKRRILEIYLNIAQWGPNGEFGVDAGARYAFGKSARDIGSTEAALLAAVLPNPVIRDARRPGRAVRRLAAIYRSRAAANPGLDSCLRPRRAP